MVGWMGGWVGGWGWVGWMAVCAGWQAGRRAGGRAFDFTLIFNSSDNENQKIDR